ncbi:SDR family NAD(P)-dependent oxidoreductase [Myxococcota bacterium]|nr:SDR family NAD(P)-dependent oxidoreductase [Myxococcota bacterium]
MTGAGSGIGAAVAVQFGALGWRVALGGRRLERLEQTAQAVIGAGGEAWSHPLDVAEGQSILNFFDASEAHFGVADVLVNNAGMNTPGPLHEIAGIDIEPEVATNLTGPIHMVRRALAPLLEQRKRADLIFVSSDAARHPRPRQAVYTATKYGLEGLSRTLAMELEGTGIRTTIVRPGSTLSEYASSWDLEKIPALVEYWQGFGLQRHGGVMTSDAVARAVVLAVTTEPGVFLDVIEVQPEAPGPS